MRVLIRLALALAILGVAGCPNVSGDLLSGATVEPSELPFSGGTVTIRAFKGGLFDAAEARARAIVIDPDESTQSLRMRQVPEDSQALQVLFVVPPNGDPSGAEQLYTFRVSATAGNSVATIEAGTVRLRGALQPPLHPFAGDGG